MKTKEELRIYNREWAREGNRSLSSREKFKEYDRKRGKLEARRQIARDWFQKNKDIANSYQRIYREKLRLEIISYYSQGKNCCECCGENHIQFLAIDHIKGGGKKHRKEIGISSINRWLKRNKFPKGFRILCHNCNLSLGFYKFCPHRNVVSDNKAT